MPRPALTGSDILITVGGTDITDFVVWANTQFDAQMSAIPGTCSIVCRDPDQVLDFTTGDVVELTVDTVKLFGGYITQVHRQYFFPADDTTIGAANVRSRQWVLSGVDYNILFDKRVLRNPTSYTSAIPRTAGPITDGEVITDWFPTYFDLPAGMTISAGDKKTFTNGYRFPDQGTTMRKVMDDLAQYGSIYYIDADLVLNFIPVQNTMCLWGLSDVPNWLTSEQAIDQGAPYTLATIGFREGEVTEDATAVVNDALVWGGSQWASDGDIVFSRRTNSTSITDHKRWQLGEVRVGEENYKTFAEVDARAKVIVDGDESGTFAEGSKGLVNPEMQFRATWFAHDVPRRYDADPITDHQHVRPGYSMRIRLFVFGGPLDLLLPLRQVQITFPTLQGETGKSYVQFQGFFGVLMSDPHWLWSYLRSLSNTRQLMVTTASNASAEGSYGAFYQGEPSPEADGAETVFTIPFPYVPLSVQVFDGGQIQRRDFDYTESSPTTGEITFASGPAGPLWVVCYLAG